MSLGFSVTTATFPLSTEAADEIQIDICGERGAASFQAGQPRYEPMYRKASALVTCPESFRENESVPLDALEPFLRKHEISSAVFLASVYSTERCVVGEAFDIGNKIYGGGQTSEMKVLFDPLGKHAVLVDPHVFATTGVAINLREHKAVTHLCGKGAYRVKWSPDGGYIGYVVGELLPMSRQRLVVFSMNGQQPVMDVEMGMPIDDFAWDPFSERVAVLLWEQHAAPGSFNPLNWLSRLAGHGTYYKAFSMKTFYRDGLAEYSHARFITGIGNGVGRIRWQLSQ